MAKAAQAEHREIRYAWNGDIALAYRVFGDGPVDLLYLQGNASNVELSSEHPGLARFFRDLGRYARVIVTDRRGLGCSERFTPVDTPPVETLMEDILTVLDDVGSERPVVMATSDCGFFVCPFAATHPGRTAALILYGASPTWLVSDEIPWGRSAYELDEACRWARENWGTGAWSRRAHPSIASDDRQIAWFARYERLSLSPGALYSEASRFAETDIRAVLPLIQVPTLVLHRLNDGEESVEGGRYIAAHIPGARLVELDGGDHFPWVGDELSVIREVEQFLSSTREEEAALDRVLATVLFTDIVGSTARAAELGDRRWQDLLARHDSTVRALLGRYRGREIDTAGDGFFAAFDGPARAVRCAQSIVDAVRPLEIEVRAGLHTGEVETEGDKIGGLAVNIGARVAATAGPSEVVVSQTVKDLVAGSGLVFTARGAHELKGVPGDWHLFTLS
jgi:class 3 adenylate cyclase